MRTIFPKAGWMFAGVLALYVLSALAGVVTGGPLDPPGAPAPTYRTLDLIPGSWMQILNSTDGDPDGCSSSRFRCVMNGEGVLDLETGLVWQRTASGCDCSWEHAFNACLSAAYGGRQGWRLPRVEELLSLIDPVTHLLPGNSPISLAGTTFWSATTAAGTAFVPKHAYTLEFDGEIGGYAWSSRQKETDVVDARICVRGGGGEGFRS